MAGIPVERCLSGRDLSEPRLSPDGMALVVAESVAGSSALVLHRIDGIGLEGAGGRVITGLPAPRVARGFGGGCWCWAIDCTAVVYAAVDGNLWWQPLDGPGRQLTEHGPERVAQAPAMAPDGSFVTYVLDQAEVWCAWLAGEGGAPPRSERVDHRAADFCFDPVPLPDSSGVAWQAWNSTAGRGDEPRRNASHLRSRLPARCARESV